MHGYHGLILMSSICTNVKNSVSWGTSVSLPAKDKKGKKDGLFVVTLNLNVESYFDVAVVLPVSFYFLGTT